MQAILKNDDLVTINPNYGYKYGNVRLDAGMIGQKHVLESQEMVRR